MAHVSVGFLGREPHVALREQVKHFLTQSQDLLQKFERFLTPPSDANETSPDAKELPPDANEFSSLPFSDIARS
jgi:hypothetical protein